MIDIYLVSCLPKTTSRTIGYMLKNKFADVRLTNGKGIKWEINKGLRQGGILSPLLFYFYIKGCIEDIVAHDVKDGTY